MGKRNQTKTLSGNGLRVSLLTHIICMRHFQWFAGTVYFDTMPEHSPTYTPITTVIAEANTQFMRWKWYYQQQHC